MWPKRMMDSFISFLSSLFTFGPRTRTPAPAHTTIRFHKNCAQSVDLAENNSVATRRYGYDDGVVFSQTPIPANQAVSIQILDVGTKYKGAPFIGFTSMNPARISKANMKTETIRDWSVRKDVMWMRGLFLHDLKQFSILSFYADTSGNIKFTLDGSPQENLLRVENYNRPLWAVFDICGKFSSVKLVDFPVEIAPQESHVLEINNRCLFQHPQSERSSEVASNNVTGASTSSHDCGCKDCIICMNDIANTVFIDCGHICMCIGCAEDYARRANGHLCPVCRSPIRSFLKTYSL